MPTDNPHYQITFDDAISAHETVLSVSGGRSGILNESSLLSALARPYCGYFDQIEEKAAALLEAIIQNHGFVDGNKRTATFPALSLIELSGFKLVPKDETENIDHEIEELVVSVAKSQQTFEDVRNWFQTRLKPA